MMFELNLKNQNEGQYRTQLEVLIHKQFVAEILLFLRGVP